MAFNKLSIRDAEHVADPTSGRSMFHVRDPHALIQAAGYLKHTAARTTNEFVYFRGESKLYKSLPPTLYRGVSTHSGQSRRIGALNRALNATVSGSRIFTNMDPIVREPLLQHYGARTSWIDVVDNVWIALWFACHQAFTAGSLGQYLHFEQRTTSKEPNGFAYIALIAADASAAQSGPRGVIIGRTTELVDLRIAAPSYFVRSHAQHGLLLRMRGRDFMRPLDYASQIRGTIRIALVDALQWLGHGTMLGVHALFPPPFYDYGYDILLGSGFPASKSVGAIQHVGS